MNGTSVSRISRFGDIALTLRTIISCDKALGSKLLQGRLRSMWEKQHVPIAVSHVEDVSFQFETPKKAETEEKERFDRRVDESERLRGDE